MATSLQSDPEPFRASAQYVAKQGQKDIKNPEVAEQAGGNDDEDAAMDEQCCDGDDQDCEICNAASKTKSSKGKTAKKKRDSKQKKVPAAACEQVVAGSAGHIACEHGNVKDGHYKPHDYCCARDAYIKKAKMYLKVSHGVASHMWKTSSDCRALLASLSLPELKRRRFAPKGTTVHPYRDDC